MSSFGVDIYTSRRDYHHKCKWWKRDDDERNLSILVHNKKPSGIFYAKEVTFQNNDKNINNSFIFENSDITLKSMDVLIDLKPSDIVEYDDEIWNVINVQRKDIHKNTQFGKHNSYITYIRIRK